MKYSFLLVSCPQNNISYFLIQLAQKSNFSWCNFI